MREVVTRVATMQECVTRVAATQEGITRAAATQQKGVSKVASGSIAIGVFRFAHHSFSLFSLLALLSCEKVRNSVKACVSLHYALCDTYRCPQASNLSSPLVIQTCRISNQTCLTVVQFLNLVCKFFTCISMHSCDLSCQEAYVMM